MSRHSFTIKDAPRDRLDLNRWESISLEGLEPAQALRITTLQQAISRYIAREPICIFLKQSEIPRSSFLRAFNRCVAIDARGRQFGWKGLLPYLRVNEPTRKKPLVPCGRSGKAGLSGAMQLLRRSNPAVAKSFDEYLHANTKRLFGHESKLRIKSAHEKFVALCKTNGVADNEWPFNTNTLGRGAVRNYINHFISARYDDLVPTLYGSKAAAKSRTGMGVASRLTAYQPLDVVELDEHRCHFIGAIGLPSPQGVRWVPFPRITILLVADRSGGGILGYKAIFRPEADSDDVLDVVNAACGKRQTYEFEDGMRYTARSGFPADIATCLQWCGFNQLLVDNALIHIAQQVQDRLCSTVGCDINYGPVGHFERRPTVEGIFSQLERHGFQRITSTTGSGPHDPIRQEPEDAAIRQRLTIKEALDLIEAVVADFNGACGKRNFGSNPLEQLRVLSDDEDGRGMIFPQLAPLLPGAAGLHETVMRVTVRGNQKKGVRPYFYLYEEEYGSELLADRWDLIGETVEIRFDRSDIRFARIFGLKGDSIGTACVRGRWRHSAHSKTTRIALNKLARDRQLHIDYDEDPIHRHLEYIRGRSEQQEGLTGIRPAVIVHAEHLRTQVTQGGLEVGALREPLSPRSPPADDEEVGLIVLNDLMAINGGGW